MNIYASRLLLGCDFVVATKYQGSMPLLSPEGQNKKLDSPKSSVELQLNATPT